MKIEDSLERASLIALLYSGKHSLVDTEANGDGERGQEEVGDHADEGEETERDQHEEHRAEHHAGLLDVPPVDQVHSC